MRAEAPGDVASRKAFAPCVLRFASGFFLITTWRMRLDKLGSYANARFFYLVTEQQDEYRAEQQQSNTYDPAQPGGHRRTGSNASVHSNSHSLFLFPSNMLPGPGPRPRSVSDHALEPPNNFTGQMVNIGSALDDSMGDVILPPQGQHRRYDLGGGSFSPSLHRNSFGGAGGGGYAQAPGSVGLDNGFLSPDLFGLGGGGGGGFGGGLGLGLNPGAVGLRRAKSDAAGRGQVRQSRSGDIRGTGNSAGPMFLSEDFIRSGGGHGQFLSPVELPPAIRSRGQGQHGYHHRSASGGSMTTLGFLLGRGNVRDGRSTIGAREWMLHDII
ncbi:hypothetical protein B0H14DRAFT_2559465 [Mycena olivaceomarginata]|nr:hypothetical protein B0H14DRAFT_2559465 [Mycena olivaceomarginata]